MRLQRIAPRPELAPYIDTFWVFEHDFGVPTDDSRVIAPNGKAKFIYPYSNALSTLDNGLLTPYPEQDIFFIGIWDKPVTLISKAQVTGTIGIEITPAGVHRFTRIPAFEMVNRIFSFADIYGQTGRQLIEQLGNTTLVDHKVNLFQEFLCNIIRLNNNHNKLIDYSVNLISHSSGLISMKDVEHKMGYSKRYIDMLFKNHLGIAPKSLAGIQRFQTFYKLWANSDNRNFYQEHLYEHYHDQAHFIKAFKRYTGHAPGQYAKLKNDFGKIFYKS